MTSHAKMELVSLAVRDFFRGVSHIFRQTEIMRTFNAVCTVSAQAVEVC
jgi:hypothetical protein